jgi:hypothetical protein
MSFRRERAGPDYDLLNFTADLVLARVEARYYRTSKILRRWFLAVDNPCGEFLERVGLERVSDFDVAESFARSLHGRHDLVLVAFDRQAHRRRH